MKIIAFIMAVMVLALNCVPCCGGSYGTKALTKVSKPADQQEHNETDNCSPFCSCNCCAGFTHLFAPSKAEPAIIVSAEKNAFHLPSKITHIALPVWQPPQLS